ncbi:hypothetical protein [Couchioplanes azureus]|uniref:hypothetical protein n=1 Tax=Couchioplanes caeruleus TaxID=56438 RepID=UPI001670DE32|nr:hypothetical protein [Couchioplanes caeruleus]GGQ41974.1 hypothetical protein GCM10010166_07140 [Couchioplanes caeruleus subsp. azureus]
MRSAHIDADRDAEEEADGSKDASDHDPQVARTPSKAPPTLTDANPAEGNSGTTAPAGSAFRRPGGFHFRYG